MQSPTGGEACSTTKKATPITIRLLRAGKDPWNNTDRGRFFEWKCAYTGQVFTKFDSGNYFNRITSFQCESCKSTFDGSEIDQPYVRN